MRTRRTPEPGILVMGVLSNSEEALSEAKTRVKDIFSPLLRWTVPLSFESFTDYYEEEMGHDIFRSYWVLTDRLARGALVEAKLATNGIERKMRTGEKRRVNLDPGLLTPESLILASTKPYSHRVYISKGIYGEITYMFRKDGQIEFFPWTYPDYRSPTAVDFFSQVRKDYLLS